MLCRSPIEFRLLSVTMHVLSGYDFAPPRLAVAPPAQGTGVATALVADAEDVARAAGARGLVISVISWNEPAHALYRGLGFVRDDVRTWRPVPAVELVVSTKAL